MSNIKTEAKKLQYLTYSYTFSSKTQSYPDDFTLYTKIAKQWLLAQTSPKLMRRAEQRDIFTTILFGFPN